VETVNRYFFEALMRYSDLPMQVHRERTWTFADAAREVHGVTKRLKQLGVQPGDRVALIAENSPRWMHVYAGILAAGGVVVPRGLDITDTELAFILEHSGSKVVFAEKRAIPEGHTVIDMAGDDFPAPEEVDDATLQAYATSCAENDLVCLLYTSGTTGQPKGVMLEQRNIAHNIRYLPKMVGMEPGDGWVSVLPAWHTFEQTVELCGQAAGCHLIYSDKRRLKDDLRNHGPQFFASVPRIWQSIHDGTWHAVRRKSRILSALLQTTLRGSRMWRAKNPLGWPLHALGNALFYRKIRAAIGGKLKVAVSGGGYLPKHIDEFFAAAGINLLIGYGLTETAPVVALRVPDDNVLGTIGRAVPETEIRVGKKGTFEVRGPQIMRGYYRNEELTKTVIDDQGWFDTGDLGKITPSGDLVFIGRQKETIVLSGGENIEPDPIETAILQSPLIQQVMLVGQDRKSLAALVVPEPDSDKTDDRLLQEVRTASSGFRSFERVNRIEVLDEPFSVENGLLTATLKMRRNVIADEYRDKIDALYSC